MRLALKIFMRNYGDFVDVILLYPSIIYMYVSQLEFVFTCLFNDTDTTSEYEVCSHSIRIGIVVVVHWGRGGGCVCIQT